MTFFQVNLTDNEQEENLLKAAELVPFPAFLATVRWVIIAVGLPLNILVACVILRTRQLHNPRNAFWLGNVFCHSVTLLMGAFEATVATQPQRYPNIFCQIYALLVGSPYTNLLVSLLLATTDRWIAISYPLRHRSHVTVFRVAVFLVSSWALVLIAMTSPYWSGKIQLPFCSVQPNVMKWVTFSHFVLVVIIIIAQVKVYARACEYFRFGAHRPPNSTDRRQPVYVVGGSSGSSSHNRLKSDEYFVHLPDKTINRFELAASVTLCCGVASLTLFTLPLACLFLAIFVCQATNQSCSGSVVALIPFARELLLLHAVVSPLLYVFRSREFSCAFRRMMSCSSVKRRRRRRQREEERDIPLRQFE